jgi:hypothetical protein
MSLPDPEAVRLDALQRSWQRDREVARRRLARRWVVWALLRYGLPAMLVLGTAAGVWVWALPEAHARLVLWLHPPPPPPVIDPSPSALHQAISATAGQVPAQPTPLMVAPAPDTTPTDFPNIDNPNTKEP